MHGLERRMDAPREPIRGGLGGPSMVLPQREETEAEAIERNRQEIEFMRMEKEARARREEEERQREAYEEDIRRRDAKRAAQQKRKEETKNRLWKNPMISTPESTAGSVDSGDGNDNDNGNDSGSSNLNDAAGGTWGKAKPTADTPQNAHLPPSQAWGGDGDRNITKSSLSIEEIAKQEVSDAAREEELGRAHDLQRSAHDSRQPSGLSSLRPPSSLK